MFSSTFWRSRFSLEAKMLVIRGSGRAFKTTGCAALLEDLLFCGRDLDRAFCFAFEARSRSALPEERLSRVGAGRAALLNKHLSCGGDETESLLSRTPETSLSCGDDITECLASVVPATLAGTNTLATTNSWSALAPL